MQEIYYLPDEADVRYESYSCGYLPNGGFSKRLDAGSNLQIAIGFDNGELGMFVHVSSRLNERPFIGELSAIVKVSETENKKYEFSLRPLVGTGGRYLVDGMERTSYHSNYQLGNVAPDRLSVAIAWVEVGDEREEMIRIDFTRVEKMGLMMC